LHDILIEKNNFWRQLKDKCSSTKGRKLVNVIRMFKYLLLKNYYKLLDRGLIERTKTDMLFKYFLYYVLEETNLIAPGLLTVIRRKRLRNKENQYVQGSLSEKSVYKYYYQLEDNGIKQGTIPAESTTIYFVKSGEDAYLETIVTTEYYLNKNYTPATRCMENSETTYKLYVPEGSITNVYEFNAE
jgi:hypothetical protein